MLFLLYPSMSGKTFETFGCRSLGDGTSVHKLDYSVYCTQNDEKTSEYIGYVSFATLMIFVLPDRDPGALWAGHAFQEEAPSGVDQRRRYKVPPRQR